MVLISSENITTSTELRAKKENIFLLKTQVKFTTNILLLSILLDFSTFTVSLILHMASL